MAAKRKTKQTKKISKRKIVMIMLMAFFFFGAITLSAINSDSRDEGEYRDDKPEKEKEVDKPTKNYANTTADILAEDMVDMITMFLWGTFIAMTVGILINFTRRNDYGL